MKIVNKSDFSEIVKYAIECPNPQCCDFIEFDEDPDAGDVLTCESCDTEFEVV